MTTRKLEYVDKLRRLLTLLEKEIETREVYKTFNNLPDCKKTQLIVLADKNISTTKERIENLFYEVMKDA